MSDPAAETPKTETTAAAVAPPEAAPTVPAAGGDPATPPAASPAEQSAPLDEAALKAKWEEERLAGRPESPDKYEAPDLKAYLPDGIDPKDIAPLLDTELFGWWRETAHAAGFSQEQFAAGVEKVVKHLATYDAIDPAVENQRLGERAAIRREQASMFCDRVVPQQLRGLTDALRQSAAGIELIEWIAARGQMQTGNLPTVAEDPRALKAEWDELIQSGKTRTPEGHKRALELGRVLFPGGGSPAVQ